MHVSISPTDFARIMALPVALRHDVLEFLGSTPVDAENVDQLVRSLTARVAANERRSAGRSA